MSAHFPSPSPKWRRYLRFWRADIHADTDEELRLHLESRVEELVRGGAPRDRALAQAHGEFGDIAAFRAAIHDIDNRIDSRRSRTEWLAAVRDDVRYSARSLLRSRAFLATVIVAMALGLGLNAAMFTFLDDVFFRPPVGMREPGMVRRLWITHYKTGDGKPFASLNVTYPMYARLAAAAGRDASVAAYAGPKSARIGHGEGAPTAMLANTTTNYLAVAGGRIARGRWFTDAENQLDRGEPVAVVSEAFVARQLADSGDALGKRILIDGTSATIIGVVAGGFTGPDLGAVDVWMPIARVSGTGPAGEPWWRSESFYAIRTIARVAPRGVEAALPARLGAAERAAQRLLPYGDTLKTVELGPVNVARGPGEPAAEVTIATRLGAVAVIVLLIACANVINLLLARAGLRKKEIAIRLSLGITRARLVRLMATESLILALAAGTAALVAAYWGGTVMRKLLLPKTVWGHSAVSLRLVAFTAAASIAAGLVIGLVPAFRASRPDLTGSLRGAGHDASPHRSRLRSSLVAAQAALAMVLLVSALLFVASLRNVEGLDIGFDAQRLFFARVAFETPLSKESTVLPQGYEQLAAEVSGAPGVESVALTWIEPMRGFSVANFYFGADSMQSLEPRDRPTYNAVSPSYFRTVGRKIVRGQGFAEHGGEGAVIVNEQLARVLWHGADPVGQCMRFVKRDAPCFTVVGVVANGRMSHVVEADQASQFYLQLGKMPPGLTASPNAVVVRADPQRAALIVTSLRDRLHRIFPGGEARVKRMGEYLDDDYRPYRLGATLFTAFGVLAFVVALVGIYSTVSYTVQQRTKEFSIRTALGAQTRDVLRLVLGEELRIVLYGVVAGTILVLAGGGLIASLLYGIAPRDARILVVVAATLLLASIVGSFGPAWRAGRANPAGTLRSE
jgi:putative ABC transport system permease protein